jgi:DNA-binding beta-propeller fold protein YncE
MLKVRATSCTLILTLVMAIASSNTLLGVERAWVDSVIKTITVGTGPYGDLFDPANGYIYVAYICGLK